jgi:hypothetical protein
MAAANCTEIRVRKVQNIEHYYRVPSSSLPPMRFHFYMLRIMSPHMKIYRRLRSLLCFSPIDLTCRHCQNHLSTEFPTINGYFCGLMHEMTSKVKSSVC